MTFRWRPDPFPPRHHPPVQPVLPTGTFPTPVRGQTASGLTWMAVSVTGVPLVHFAWVFDGGIRSDWPRRGIPEMISRCALEGTVRRSAERVVLDLERWGARVSVDVQEDAVVWHCAGLASHWREALAVFLDIVLNPTFPPESVHREAMRWRQQIEAMRSEPDFLAREQFQALLFPEHPYGVLVPSAEALDRMHRWALLTAHAARLDPTRSAFIVVGDVNPDGVVVEVERALEGWPLRAQWTEPPSPGSVEGQGVWVWRPGSVQTEIRFGIRTPPMGTDDWIPSLVAHTVLGGGAASRLFERLREEKGFTYGAFSRHRRFVQGGMWTVVTQVRSDVTELALREVVQILTELSVESLTQADLQAALRYMIGRFIIQHQTLQAIADRLADLWTYRLPDDFWSRYLVELRAVTPTHLQVAWDLWQGNWFVVCVGDGGNRPPQVQALAERFAFLQPHVVRWTVRDTDGKMIDK